MATDRTRLVTVRSFTVELEAEIARQHLEAAGIDAFVRMDDSGGMQPPMYAFLGIRLQVNEEDVKAAEEILRSREI